MSSLRTSALISRGTRAALIGSAALVCLVTAAAAVPAEIASSTAEDRLIDAAAVTAPATAAAEVSSAALMIAPLTAAAVVFLAGVALVISATRRGSKD